MTNCTLTPGSGDAVKPSEAELPCDAVADTESSAKEQKDVVPLIADESLSHFGFRT